MGSINDEIQRVLNPIYGDKSTNHLIRLFRIDHGLLEENLWQDFLQGIDFNGSLQDKLYYLFSNFESIFNASTGLYLPGTSGNYVSTPDTADLDITGDLCLVVHIALDDWTPGTVQSLIAKYRFASNNFSYWFQVLNGGNIDISWRNSASTTTLASICDEQPEVSNGEDLWLAVTLDIDNGDSDAETKFWTSSDGILWNQLGTTQLLGTTTNINPSSSPLDVGGLNSTTNWLLGTIYYAAVYDGIGDNSAPGLGTLVAEFDASAPVGPRYRDRTGKIWTINGSAWSWV